MFKAKQNTKISLFSYIFPLILICGDQSQIQALPDTEHEHSY